MCMCKQSSGQPHNATINVIPVASHVPGCSGKFVAGEVFSKLNEAKEPEEFILIQCTCCGAAAAVPAKPLVDAVEAYYSGDFEVMGG